DYYCCTYTTSGTLLF
nr:immunoglobulin light chain junction region [Macaca mulatta]MOX32439.1 immunoglobulin light chain junction region [Macaca mulatta]